MTRRSVAWAAVALLVPAVARPCGPYPYTARFWPPPVAAAPALGADAGPLFVVPGRPVRDLLAAWRRLAGHALPDEVAAALSAPPPPGAGLDLPGVAAWTRARAGYGPPAAVDPWRPVAQDGDARAWEKFLNCPDDAWTTAARTLRERAERYGAHAPEVERWVAAQDRVFAACDGPAPLPAPAGPDQDPLARADRTYQRAAARFYNRDYAGALRDFRAVAADLGSPWSEVGALLIGRTWIRRTTVAGCPPAECLAAAEEALQAVIDGSPDPAMRHAARGALGYVLARLRPAERRDALGRWLAGEAGAEPAGVRDLGQAVVDFDVLLHRAPASPDEAEPTRWIRLLHHPDPAGAGEALTRWRSARSLPWLVAALALAPSAGPPPADLLAAAAAVGPGAPGGATVAFQRARLLAAGGEAAAAREALDPLLARDDLGAGARNRVRDLRAAVASGLDDLLAHAVLTPVETGFDLGDDGPLLVPAAPAPPAPWLGPAALAAVDRGLPVADWERVAAAPGLPAAVRRHVALTGWVRAVLVGEEDAARRLAAAAGRLDPALAPSLDAWARATDGGARSFAAAWLLLHAPGLRPTLRPAPGRHEPLAEVDAYRDNWWCPGGEPSGLSFGAAAPTPGTPLSAARRAGAAAELARLGEVAAAPRWLGAAVLAHARAVPADPRLPEALHLVVRATRHGCPEPGYGETSRAAFELLHRRYPDSPWTARTPYWFD